MLLQYIVCLLTGILGFDGLLEWCAPVARPNFAVVVAVVLTPKLTARGRQQRAGPSTGITGTSSKGTPIAVAAAALWEPPAGSPDENPGSSAAAGSGISTGVMPPTFFTKKSVG